MVSGQGGVEARNSGGEEGGDLAGALPGRQVFGGREFDGHFGIHEGVQTVRDVMTANGSESPVWE